MLRKRVGVATMLKIVSPFVTSIHYIVHKTNLVAIEAAKSIDCKSLFTEIDTMINILAAYLNFLRNKNVF